MKNECLHVLESTNFKYKSSDWTFLFYSRCSGFPSIFEFSFDLLFISLLLNQNAFINTFTSLSFGFLLPPTTLFLLFRRCRNTLRLLLLLKLLIELHARRRLVILVWNLIDQRVPWRSIHAYSLRHHLLLHEQSSSLLLTSSSLSCRCRGCLRRSRNTLGLGAGRGTASDSAHSLALPRRGGPRGSTLPLNHTALCGISSRLSLLLLLLLRLLLLLVFLVLLLEWALLEGLDVAHGDADEEDVEGQDDGAPEDVAEDILPLRLLIIVLLVVARADMHSGVLLLLIVVHDEVDIPDNDGNGGTEDEPPTQNKELPR